MPFETVSARARAGAQPSVRAPSRCLGLAVAIAVATAILALGSSLPSATAQEARHRVQGVLTNADGEPLRGQHVFLTGWGDSWGESGRGVTAADGTFGVVVPDGTYYIDIQRTLGSECTVTGYQNPASPSQVSVAVQGEDIAGMELTVSGTPGGTEPYMRCAFPAETLGHIKGTVTDAQGEPVEGIWLAAYPHEANGAVYEGETTAADGTFHLRLRPGVYVLWVHSESISSCEVSRLNDPMALGRAIFDTSDGAVEGLRVRVSEAADASLGAATCRFPTTAPVEVTVWRRISDPSLLFVSTRPAGGRWRTVNTPLDMSMESRSGRFHQSNTVLVEVPLEGAPSVTVEVTVWRRISDPSRLYVSTRPEGGRWRTVNAPLDMSMESRSGRFHQSNAVLVEVPLPSRTVTKALEGVEYTVVLEPGWDQVEELADSHIYRLYEPWATLWVRPFGPVEDTLSQYAEWVRDGLEWELAAAFPSYALFEFVSLEAITEGGELFYELRYRRQDGPDFCVSSVVERIGATEVRAGVIAGVRLASFVCEQQEAAYAPARKALLDSLQIASSE